MSKIVTINLTLKVLVALTSQEYFGRKRFPSVCKLKGLHIIFHKNKK